MKYAPIVEHFQHFAKSKIVFLCKYLSINLCPIKFWKLKAPNVHEKKIQKIMDVQLLYNKYAQYFIQKIL
jgi:hypothetical protein